jgi:hypothetical protein
MKLFFTLFQLVIFSIAFSQSGLTGIYCLRDLYGAGWSDPY